MKNLAERFVLVAAAGLVFGGCGDSSGGDSGSASGTESGTATGTDTSASMSATSMTGADGV